MGSTEITIGSVSLKNPVICGSGEHVMTEAGLQSALDTGVGAVVAKSINETQAAKDQLDRTDVRILRALQLGERFDVEVAARMIDPTANDIASLLSVPSRTTSLVSVRNSLMPFALIPINT